MRFLKFLFCHQPVPMHCSNHYRRESFYPSDQRTLF
jgi:hypothetical protein